VILGGTFEVHNTNTQPHPDTAKQILERCRAIAPHLVRDLHIIRHGVGLRPARQGGIRLETEYKSMGAKSIPIIHNYGHAGYGMVFDDDCCE
jgi:D-amino-acid oxidase